MKNFPKISIVIVTANNKTYIRKCLDSILKVDYPCKKIETIVVTDINDLQKEAEAFIKRKYKWVRIISSDHHNYSYSNNLGIKKSKSNFVMLMNDDVQLDSRCLKELVNVITKDKNIGGVGPKILLEDGRINWVGHEEHPNFYFGETGFNQEDKGQYEKIREVFSLCNATALYRKECLKDVRYFDEDFNMYYEDIDFGIRCGKTGWTLLYNPKSVAYHKHHGTIAPEKFKYNSERSRLLYVAKHFPYELPKAIMTSHLFYKDIANEHQVLFDILPESIEKLAKHHGKETVQKVVPELLKELRKMIDFEKHDFLKTVKCYKEERDKTQEELNKTREELNKTREELNKTTKEHEEELNKTKELFYNTSKRLKGVYDSKGYQYILTPLWGIVNLFKRS